MKFKKSSDVLVFAAGTVKGHSNKWAHPELLKKPAKICITQKMTKKDLQHRQSSRQPKYFVIDLF